MVALVDAQTEAEIGGFPTRAVLSKLIDTLGSAEPKSIVLKYFLDSPGKEPDSTLLAESLGKTRVILQATLNRDPPTSKLLDERFFFRGSIGKIKPALSGDEGWLPQKRFANLSPKVCFADVVQPERVPMLEVFLRQPVESLYACALAEAFGEGVFRLENDTASFGKKSLPVNSSGEVAISLADMSPPPYISARQLLKGNIDANVFFGKVVILGYTGTCSPTISVRGAPFPLHQIFLAQLRELVLALR